MANEETIYLFRGVTAKDEEVLNYFRDQRFILYRVFASSQVALPSDKEMDAIMKQCPNIEFPPSIRGGLGGPATNINLQELVTVKRPSSIFYIDSGAKIFFYAAEVDMGNSPAVRVVLSGTSFMMDPISLKAVA